MIKNENDYSLKVGVKYSQITKELELQEKQDLKLKKKIEFIFLFVKNYLFTKKGSNS
ncbi:hypothetical protein [Bacillus sp. M6-12]|uniref:hypothetical protein n=1 Tax=Bacillus sp. M6-12 TaxID=2054166 RepID=UPI0015E0D552|nr:hypothetical protein [Bacillus sp. M6-12]